MPAADGSSTVPQIAADLRPSADGCAVRTSLVAGGGQAAGSQRAYSLRSCAMGQTDGRIALFQNVPRGMYSCVQQQQLVHTCQYMIEVVCQMFDNLIAC